MTQMLKPIMVVSYVLALVLTLVAAAIKLAAIAGAGSGYQAGNWGIGACTLFLCALASAHMMDTMRR